MSDPTPKTPPNTAMGFAVVLGLHGMLQAYLQATERCSHQRSISSLKSTEVATPVTTVVTAAAVSALAIGYCFFALTLETSTAEAGVAFSAAADSEAADAAGASGSSDGAGSTAPVKSGRKTNIVANMRFA